ncbi:membrane protein [Planomonospora sphaerica]|uniref:Membrane protein n=2 Tax=Streptosporangiaceae TaxID=2004 RepID=A0A171DHX5_9ACTN|nr:membrane protein [Planomonospora sphaerica]
MARCTGRRLTGGMTESTQLLRVAVLIGATVSTGLMAGLFYAFAVAVMPGLGRAGDRTFVEAMQRINVAILNGWFAAAFAGAALLTAAAGLLHLGRPELPWIAAAFVAYGAALVVTFRMNIPLNDALDAAGEPGRIPDLAAVRGRFEAAWVRWNVVRALVCTAALALLSWALAV